MNSATMKEVLIALLVLSANVIADFREPAVHKDIYRNLLSFSARIIGGSLAERYQFPYQVSVRWTLFLIYSHICGGTLINENWVLTAAHCKASLGTYQVALGQLKTNEYHRDVQIISVSQFILHPQYAGGVAANDIALIKLKTPAKLSKAVQVIPLPTDLDCSSLDEAILSGWGLTSWFPVPPITLRWAHLPRITNEQCRINLTTILGDAEPLDESMICTGSNKGRDQSACSGDSGGPLVRQANGKLIGVVSWGVSPCGSKGAPTVYTRVCSHLDFINDILDSYKVM